MSGAERKEEGASQSTEAGRGSILERPRQLPIPPRLNMKIRIMKSYTLLFLLCLASPVWADLSPSALFRDGAVLQHGKPLPVWGTASPGQPITVTFAEQTATVTADAEGRWLVTLDPLEPSSEPAALVIAGGETVTLTDIVVGEVWLASGQSNMAWNINRAYDADLEIATGKWPLIREFRVPPTVADVPQSNIRGNWRSAQPETIAGFSAVAYFFARDLHQALDMPVGIINSSRGGTPAEAWTDPATLARPDFAVVQERAQSVRDNYAEAEERHEQAVAEWTLARDAAQRIGEIFTISRPAAPAVPRAQNAPSSLYNAMIHPLAPYAIRGAIWYQGEGNAGRHQEYHALFSALIEGWRDRFQQGDFPFYWVQLAEFRASGPANTEWAFLREAQTKTLALPATGQAVILDVSDIHDIHPRNKQTVGRRLARLALHRTYGHDIVDSGPTFQRADFEDATVRILFSNTHDGLRTTAAALRGFEMAGEDRVFFAATASISDGSVVLVSADVPQPVAVRYAWRNASEATLSNGAGLPATPFRTDTW
jgi:sialate O-acetylesterase